MRNISLPLIASAAVGLLTLSGCGSKGDPQPNQRHPPASCVVRATGLRTFEVILPTKDIQGNQLLGIEAIRVYYLPMGTAYPSALEVFQRGEVVLERRRPNVPYPGSMVRLDLSRLGHPSGWLVVAAFRVGNVAGEPSQVMPWMDPSF